MPSSSSSKFGTSCQVAVCKLTVQVGLCMENPIFTVILCMRIVYKGVTEQLTLARLSATWFIQTSLGVSHCPQAQGQAIPMTDAPQRLAVSPDHSVEEFNSDLMDRR